MALFKTDLKGRRVILIDHDDMIRCVYREVLQDEGCETKSFENIADVITAIHDGFVPDIIISDEIYLNEENKLAEILRSYKYRGLIIMFTASEFEITDQSKYIDSFIPKLSGPEKLIMTMQLSIIQQAIKQMPRIQAN